MSNSPFQPDWTSPPGDTIESILEEKNMCLNEFGELIGFSVDEVCKLLFAKLEINENIADKLSKVLGGSKQFWLKRESNYRDILRRLNGRT